LNGHDHHYQRTYAIGNYKGKSQKGVHYIVTGGGGASIYPTIPTSHSACRKEIHHITVLDFLDDRILGRAIDCNGNIFDAFILDKEADISPDELVAFEIYQIDRDLVDALSQLSIDSNKKEIKIDTTLKLINPFDIPIRILFSWNNVNGWEVTPQEIANVLQPNSSILIPIKVEGRAIENMSVPSFSLHFTTPEGEKAFRNDQLTYSPIIQIHPELTAISKGYRELIEKHKRRYSPAKLPLPIRKMDGTPMENKPITDNYPEDGLKFNTCIINGKLSEINYNNFEMGGFAELENDEFDNSVYNRKEKKGFKIKYKSVNMPEKICVGEFKILPWPENFNSALKTLKNDELFAYLQDQTNNFRAVKGLLRITAYSKNGVAGEFDIILKNKDGSFSSIKGKFKLPLIMS